MAEQVQKKLIRIETPTMDNPISIQWEEDIDECTLAEIIDGLAEEYLEAKMEGEAENIRALTQRDVRHKGNGIKLDTKVNQLTFDLVTTETGVALVADLSFEQTHAAGSA